MRHDEGAICHRIAEARTSAGLTQQELANTLTMTAGVTVTRRDMRRFERSRVPWDLLADIARLTNTTRGWLLYGERFQDDPNPRASVFERSLSSTEQDPTAEGGASAPRRLTAGWAVVALALSLLAAVIVLRLSDSIVAALAVLVVVNFLAKAQVLASTVAEELARFAPGEPSDDRTLVMVKRS